MSSSQELFSRAKQFIPGGVNSPVRSFKAVGGEPLFFSHGNHAYLFDVQGKSYIDYVGSWGALILGHAPENIVKAVQEAAAKGLSFGASIAAEADLAEKIRTLMPNLKKIRLMNSGTEATMTAVRLARGFTGRKKILKFNGCYHGHVDALLVKAGSGLASFSIPDSAGIPEEVVEQTLSVDFNNLEQVNQVFLHHGKEIAAVIVEPVAGNMGCILPLSGFLEGLRELCNYYGSLLIFDEVITGFRVALGGAQALYHVKPDLTTLGKIIGGGLPIGALGGRSDIMDCLAPEGSVYQAGTLSGNPISVAAGLATLEMLSVPDFYTDLSAMTRRLVEGLLHIAKEIGIPLQGHYVGGLFGLFFTEESEIYQYEQVARCNPLLFKQFFHEMLAEGIYFAPSPFESGFVSSVHSEEDLSFTLNAAEKVFTKLKKQILEPSLS
ncbi:glutamate-1-semialdehyde 2,1-aminomutase [Rickettsiella endosymbiont of Dermanyssus gallinae]|uniref:glutamate-1-semialdehyde 2,1-aminomutase n=1 Tax=Rickettsiella endosymbiont of Dermanyssus gallinae TaxID=2856608 RepID=UPI001C529227|nr:glutamate-1-semialdehyde 2,1-aminomutase [Rickettsiella endosymbiont of Dermanyssus gallinae]